MTCIVCNTETKNKFCSNNCRTKDYCLKHPDRVAKTKHKHYLKYRERILQKDKENYAENPEKQRAMCRRWYSNNKEYRKQYTANYRANNKELFHRLKNLERFSGNREIILKRDGKCVGCKTKSNLMVHHIDGSGHGRLGKNPKINNELSNLITLCRSCHTTLHMYQKHFDIRCQTIDDIVRTMMRVIEWRKPPRKSAGNKIA